MCSHNFYLQNICKKNSTAWVRYASNYLVTELFESYSNFVITEFNNYSMREQKKKKILSSKTLQINLEVSLLSLQRFVTGV